MTRTGHRTIACALAALFASPLGCGSEGAQPRLVLLYAPCSVNKDFLGPYSGLAGATPQLDRFAEQTVVFERHQTESGLSGIAYASLFTGAQANTHGVYAHPQKLRDGLVTISETFAAAGFETWAFHEHMMAAPALAYAQGVAPERQRAEVIGPEGAFAEILDRLAADPEARVFVSVAFVSGAPHWPYRGALRALCSEQPATCAAAGDLAELAPWISLYRAKHLDLSYDYPSEMDALALTPEEKDRYRQVVELLYVTAIHRLDATFGAIVEAIRERGLLDESVVAFTSDHGEVLYRENAPLKWTHGHALAPEVLGIPLLIRAPGVAPGRHAGVTRSIDVYPTLAGLAGVPVPASADVAGVDLSAALRGEAAPPDLVAFSHTALVRNRLFQGWRDWEVFRRINPGLDPDFMWVAMRRGDRVDKLRSTRDEGLRFEAFDLGADPGETTDLRASGDDPEDETTRDLRRYRARLIEDSRERQARGEQNVSMEVQRQMLEALGYVR